MCRIDTGFECSVFGAASGNECIISTRPVLCIIISTASGKMGNEIDPDCFIAVGGSGRLRGGGGAGDRGCAAASVAASGQKRKARVSGIFHFWLR